MKMEPPVNVTRDLEAIQIPDGHKVLVPAGSSVRITQALGGTYTVITDWGVMVRIADKDADAIGKTPLSAEEKAANSPVSEGTLESQVWDKLRTVYDPEIPVNIVELGLVYNCTLVDLPSGSKKVEIQFTLTAPGCGMGDVLKLDIEEKVKALPGVDAADVQVVFEPQWDRSMMSDAARLQLGM
jgi:probable FeS assembly SUF system protein SufT